jgi:hypothetical protein
VPDAKCKIEEVKHGSPTFRGDRSMVSSVDGIESEVLCSMVSPPIFPNPAQFQVLRELGSRLNSELVPLDKRSRTVTTRDSQKHPKTHLEVGTEKGDCSKYPELISIIIGPENGPSQPR